MRTGGQLVMLVAINVLLLVAGAAISGGTFLSLFNLQSMASQLPEIGFSPSASCSPCAPAMAASTSPASRWQICRG